MAEIDKTGVNKLAEISEKSWKSGNFADIILGKAAETPCFCNGKVAEWFVAVDNAREIAGG